MTLARLVDELVAEFGKAELDGIVTFVCYGFLLNDGARTGFDDSDGNHGTVSSEELRHTDLLAQNGFLHWYIPPFGITA